MWRADVVAKDKDYVKRKEEDAKAAAAAGAEAAAEGPDSAALAAEVAAEEKWAGSTEAAAAAAVVRNRPRPQADASSDECCVARGGKGARRQAKTALPKPPIQPATHPRAPSPLLLRRLLRPWQGLGPWMSQATEQLAQGGGGGGWEGMSPAS